jgi:D-alanine transaminase
MTVYLNGEFLPLAEARVSVLDRGFMFGDGVYEVIPVYARRPFRLKEHLARLAHSLAGIRLADPMTEDRWTALIGEVIARQPFDDQALYLQITRGVARRDHLFPRDTPPTIFLMSNPLPPLSQKMLEVGVAAVTAKDERWHHCDLKTTSLIGNVLMRQFAADRGAAETLLFRDGLLTEGAATNVLIVEEGVILAPPQDWRVLPGITFGAVRDLAKEHGLPLEMRDIGEAELRQADEIWLASSLRELLAVTRLDGQPVGNGRPGPVWRRMRELFQHAK